MSYIRLSVPIPAFYEGRNVFIEAVTDFAYLVRDSDNEYLYCYKEEVIIKDEILLITGE